MYHVGSMSQALDPSSQVLMAAEVMASEDWSGLVQYGVRIMRGYICRIWSNHSSGISSMEDCHRGAANGDRRLLKIPEPRIWECEGDRRA